MSTPESTPRVLRVGLLRGGELHGETLVEPGKNVTFGRSRRNTLVVPDPAMPRRQVLFGVERAGTVLYVSEGMSGRVALEGGVWELNSAPGAQRERRVRLDTRSRGRVQIGEWTVLFQWVPAPLVSSRAPPSFRPPLIADDDPVFAGSLGSYAAMAAGFFLILANVPPPAAAAELDAASERIIALAQVVEAELPAPVQGRSEDAERRAEHRAERRAERQARRAERGAERSEDPPAGPSSAEQEGQVRSLVARIVGTHGEAGRSDLFASSDDVGAGMAARLGEVDAYDVAGLGPGIRGGVDGRADAGQATLGRSGAGQAEVGAGPEVQVRARVGGIETTGGAPAQKQGIEEAIRAYKQGIEACYVQALRDSPELAGRLVLSVSVTAGVVTVAEVVEDDLRDDGLVRCAELRASAWRFDRDVTMDFLAPFSLSR